MCSTARSNSERHYPLGPGTRTGILAVAAGFLVFPALLAVLGVVGHDSALLWTGAIVAAIAAPFSGFLFLSALYPRLNVSQNGIRIRGVGTAAFLPWSKIEAIRLKPGAEGLILEEPSDMGYAKRQSHWSCLRFGGASLYDQEQRRYMTEGRFIPLTGFGYWLKEGDLLDEINRWAPSLTADVEDQRAAFHAEQQKARRVLLTVVFTSGLALVVIFIGHAVYPRLPEATRQPIDQVLTVLKIVVVWLIAGAISVYAFANFRSAWIHLRRRQILLGFFWAIFAILQVLLALVVIRLAN